jgi:glycosyltransferase involved in cell wall biosynthesis
MNTFAPVRPAEIPVLLTAHSCVLTWWRAVHGVSAPASWGRYRRLVSDALERADLVVAPTRAFLAELQAVYGHLPRARVIRNGRSIRRDPRLDAGERLVLSAGRLWDEAKNARLVAEAATGIHGRVVVIGPGEVAGVETAGVLDDRGVIDWLARAAVFVEPARYEPFGLAALEAALCGCALVLGDIPTLRELWEEAAAFVSPDDAEALSFRVNQLLADDQRRRRAAVAAYTTALRYRPQAMAAGYLRAYRSLERDRSSAANMSRSSRSPAEGVRA